MPLITELVLVQIVLVPIVMSAVALILGRKIAHNTGWLAFVTFLYTTLLSFIVATEVASGTFLVENYDWIPSIGLVMGLRADGLSTPLVLTINLLSMAISMYSVPYIRKKLMHRESEYGPYYAFYLLFAASMSGSVMATNLIEFFIFYELMLIPSYFLVVKWGYGERERIGLMYFIWTHASSLILLTGILLTYTTVGSYDISAIPALVEQMKLPLETTIGISLLMLVAFFIKMALFGLHIWLPHVHAEAPTPISSLLSPVMIGIGAYATIRTTVAFFPMAFELSREILSLWALITMLYGGIMALTQDDLKRRLAYSSISQMGYILLGISSHNTVGMVGSMFHYVSHGTCKALLFMAAGAIILQADGLRSIKKLGGLASNMPITTTATIIGFFGIMGIPPLNGFHSEWMIFTGVVGSAVDSGSVTTLITASASILAPILTACYGLLTIQKIFFGSRPEYLDNVREAPLPVTLPLLALIAITILLGVFPSAIVDILLPTIASIVGG